MKISIILMAVLASLVTVQAAEFHGYGVSFEVPDGWVIAENSSHNKDSRIVLSDNYSTIQVDVIRGINVEALIKNYLKEPQDSPIPEGITSKSWREIYSELPWYSNDAMCKYYVENILGEAKTGWGSGISVEPDGTKYAGVSTNYMEDTKPIDWTLAWTKPTYDNMLIGVHGTFNRRYVGKRIEWHGDSREYTMPKGMYNILMTIRVESQPIVESESPKTESIVNRV